MTPEPFTLHVPDEVLDDLRERLERVSRPATDHHKLTHARQADLSFWLPEPGVRPGAPVMFNSPAPRVSQRRAS